MIRSQCLDRGLTRAHVAFRCYLQIPSQPHPELHLSEDRTKRDQAHTATAIVMYTIAQKFSGWLRMSSTHVWREIFIAVCQASLSSSEMRHPLTHQGYGSRLSIDSITLRLRARSCHLGGCFAHCQMSRLEQPAGVLKPTQARPFRRKSFQPQ